MVRFSLVFAFLFFSLPAFSAPLSFVYQGQIIKPDSSSLEAASVDFTIQVLSPSPTLCVLFEETHSSVNMTGSNGLFALPVGSGTPGSGHYANIDDAFDNSRGSESPASCDGTPPYNANPGDTRVLRVTFNEGGGPVAIADQTIRSVPFAQYASKVDGLSASQLLQVRDDATYDLNQANLEWVFESATRFPELQALINGTSSQYMVSSPSSAVNFNGQVIDNIAAPSDGNDATNKNYVDSRIGGQNADALVSAPTITQDGYVLSWNNTNNEYELIDGSAAFGDNLGNHTATSNVIMGSNLISNDGTASQGLSFDGSNNANFSQNLTVSQGFSVTNGINSAGNVEIQSQSTLRLGDSDNSDHVILQAPATVTAYTMQLPDAASPAAGRVLKSDASGNLVWATDNDTGGDITGGSSVGVGGVAVYSGESAGVLQFRSINDGNGTSVSNDVVNNEVEINIDIAGTADVASAQAADTLLIRDDDDSGNLKEISRANFLSGYLTSESDPGLQTLSTAEVDQLENIDAVTITNTQWGYLGAMTGQPLESESDPGLQTLSTAEVDQLENIDAVTITNTQWGYLGAMSGQPLESESDTLATVTGRGASTATDITMSSEGEIRFADTVGGQYAAIKAPNDLSANYTLTLPADDGTPNQVLETNGSGVLSWVTPSSAGEANDGANVGAGAGQIYRDKTGSTINLKTIAAGSTKLSVTNNANDVTLDVVETNINHDNLSGFVANEHIDHSGVSIATAAGTSGLSGGGNITATRNIAIDIAGTTDVASAQGADTLLIRDDDDSGNLKEISHTNFLNGVVPAELSQLANIDAVTITNTQWGYLGAMSGQPLESESDPGLQTLSTAEVDQLENIDAVTITNTQWGYLGAMSGQPLESESDTLATVTGRGASTTDAITIDGSADAVQLTIQGHSTQTTNVNILELENSAGTVVGSFRADGVTTVSTDLATKSYVDTQVSGSGDVSGAANVGAGAGQIFRDETSGTLNLKTIAAGSTKLSVTNNANDVTLDVVETNINHDNLSGFVANEHIDHSGVSIATAAGTSGLSGGGNITATRNIAIDIAGTTDVASAQAADTLLIRDDDDSGNLKEISRANFLSGYLTSESDPGLQTLSTAEVDQLENIDTVTVTNTQWGYLGAMTGQPLESESDPGLQTLSTAEVDQLENIDAVTITNTQWGYLGALAGAPLTSESDPGLQTLSTAEVDQLENIDAVTITNTQWGYLGAMTGQPLESSASVDHGSVAGLTDDDHTQYALLAGRAGGQSLIGGTAASNDLTLESTSNATKGDVVLQPNGGNVGIGTASPSLRLTVFDNQNTTTGGAIVNVDTGANAEASLSLESNQGNVLIGMNSTAGGGSAFLTNTANTDLSIGTNDTTRITVQADGDVGIGTTSPNATLAVEGAIVNQSAIQDNSGAKDFATGNIQYTTASCGAFDLHNLKSGGSYTFIVQGATAATCSFSAYSDTGTTALTVHLPSDHAATTASTHTVYTILVAGTHAYFSWVPGL